MRIYPAHNFQTPAPERGSLSRGNVRINLRACLFQGVRVGEPCCGSQTCAPRFAGGSRLGFTLVEIALCLAIIAFALVAIIGVLPIGMNVQKDNREETIINFDANYLADAIRSGGLGFDGLTNSLVAIDITNINYDLNGNPLNASNPNIWHFGTVTNSTFMHYTYVPGNPPYYDYIVPTNGYNIVGILTTPKYTYKTSNSFYTLSTVVATFRGLTGSALDQGAGQNARDFAFQYQVTVEVNPSASSPYRYGDALNTNFSDPVVNDLVYPVNLTQTTQFSNAWAYTTNLQNNLNDLRLRFRWPVLPNGGVGNRRMVFRTKMAGNVSTPKIYAPNTPGYSNVLGYNLYFNNPGIFQKLN